MGGPGRRRGAPGAGLHRGLLTLALAGCAPLHVDYGAVAELPLLHVSSDPSRWYTPVATPAGTQVWFVDTGYARTTCDDGLAASLGLETHGHVRVRGEAGTTHAQRARLPAVTLGGHTVEGLSCQVRDLGSTSSISDPSEVAVGGVLGIDVLGRFLLEIDPGAGVMRLYDPGQRPGSAGGASVRLRREASLGTRMELPVTVDGAPLWMLLDTGADRTYVKGKAADLTPYTVREAVRVRGTGKGGGVTRDLAYYRVQELGVGDAALHGLTLLGRARPWWSDGLLGLDVISRFHGWYDLPARRARLEPVEEAELATFEDWSGEPALAISAP